MYEVIAKVGQHQAHSAEESWVQRHDNPADLVHKYPQFYWNSVAPHIQKAIRYLQATASGRQWIANLYSNVFLAEREMSFLGPQK